MTEDQFKAFSEDSQSNIIHQRGVLVSTRTTEEYKVLLYQIDGFYVELFYNRIDNSIDKLRSFRSTIPLHPYLNQIDITAVIE